MARIKRLTPQMLRKMVLQEKKRVRETLELGIEDVEKAAAKTPEVDADKQADTLEKDVDFLKVLKIPSYKQLSFLLSQHPLTIYLFRSITHLKVVLYHQVHL